VTSVPFGLLVGAFAGFYRRFLAMVDPAASGTGEVEASLTERRFRGR